MIIHILVLTMLLGVKVSPRFLFSDKSLLTFLNGSATMVTMALTIREVTRRELKFWQTFLTRHTMTVWRLLTLTMALAVFQVKTLL
jgi:hypothetical protein